jgi:hypothetical protein
MDGDREALALDEDPGQGREPFGQHVGRRRKRRQEFDPLLQHQTFAVRAGDVETVAAGVDQSGKPHQRPHVGQVAAADDSDRTALGERRHGPAGDGGETGEIRAADDRRQRPVVIEENGRGFAGQLPGKRRKVGKRRRRRDGWRNSDRHKINLLGSPSLQMHD